MVEWVQATRSAAMIPLGAVARLLPDSVRSDQAFNMLRDSAHALQERAGGRAIVLGVDDAQRLDAASAALVLHLASRVGVFVIATIRSGEPPPDAIVSLWKDGGAERLELAPLSAQSLRTLVEAALGGPLEEQAHRWLVELSQGNPLFARELVLGAVDGEWLVADRGLWRLAGQPSVAASLVELVGHRMEELSGEQRAPIELLALAEPLRLTEIEHLTSYDALADAEAHGLITVDTRADDVRLAHPLYGDVLRTSMPPCAAARCGCASRRHCRSAPRSRRTTRCASFACCWARRPIPSPLLVDAARAANLAGDPALGAQLGELAVAAGGGIDAALTLARANAIRGHFADAEAALAAIDPSGRAPVRARLSGAAHPDSLLGAGRPRATRALIERAAGGPLSRAGSTGCSRCACRPVARRPPARSPRPRPYWPI